MSELTTGRVIGEANRSRHAQRRGHRAWLSCHMPSRPYIIIALFLVATLYVLQFFFPAVPYLSLGIKLLIVLVVVAGALRTYLPLPPLN
jgi:hypothetical protein